MSDRFLPINRFQVAYFDATVNAAETIPQALGGAAGAYLIHKATGQGSVQGVIRGAQAPAAGFPRIRFWEAPGDATTLTAIDTIPLSGVSNTYYINQTLNSPFFTIEWTMGGTGGNVFLVAWVFPDAAGGGSGSGGTGGPEGATYSALGYEQLTVAAASVGFASVPASANYALITIETASIRYRDDGVAPTAAVGQPMIANQSLFYDGKQAGLTALRFIRQGLVSATANALYYSSP